MDWWLDWVNVLIGLLGDAYLDGVVDLDYSKASLQALEDVVRERYRYPVQALSDDPFASGVVAYVGESLMRVAGGAWAWSTDPSLGSVAGGPDLTQSVATHRWYISGTGEPDVVGLPIVIPDAAVELSRLSPMHLLLAAIESPGPGVWLGAYRRCREAVDAYAAAHPGWAPVKEHTLADGLSAAPPSAVLDDWLAHQQQHFPEWVAHYGGDCDYTPESIGRLTALVIKITPTVEAYKDPANADFVEGAIYYLGEMFRRGSASRWVYREFREEGDPVAANFKIQMNDNETFTAPYALLWRMIDLNDPGRTRTYYGQWTGS